MSLTAMRPDDADLVRQATRVLRAQTGVSVVFGGLRGERGIRVSAASGARTHRLRSIEVRPSKGLGGVAWETGESVTVTDYGAAREITHDFDAQILGEGIKTLTVVPIIVGPEVRGLLYAGSREGTASPIAEQELALGAARVAEELRIRDLVDERLELRMQNAGPQIASPALREELRRIASETRDPSTARRLFELVGPVELRAARSLVGPELTLRQRDVLGLVAYGLTNAQIAERLGLSELTVKSYLRAIMARFDVGTRSHAVFEARRLGLL